MASIKDFNSRELNNVTSRFNIGDEWIDYVGAESDEYVKTIREIKAGLLTGKIPNGKTGEYLIGALIADWSYTDELTMENKVELLYRQPSICDKLAELADKKTYDIKKSYLEQSSSQGATSGNKSRSSKARTKK